MRDYQKRVLKEKKKLDVKILKLSGFLFGHQTMCINVGEEEELVLMREQLEIMINYSRVLHERYLSFR